MAACAQAQPLFKANATAVGMEEVYSALASETQASYTAECLQAKNAGADAVANFTNPTVMAPRTVPGRTTTRSGSAPTWARASRSIKQQPSLGSALGSSEQWNCQDQSLTIQPAKDLNSALKQYYPEWTPGGKDYDLFSSGVCTAWAGGMAIFAKRARSRTPPSPPARPLRTWT